MYKQSKILLLLFLLIGAFISSAKAYEFPSRKIEVKPYLNLLFPNNLWETQSQPSQVKNNTAFGLGLKLRTQFNNKLGLMINSAYTKFDVPEDVSNDGLILTFGGYFQNSYGFGCLTFDFGYGIIIAADEVLGLLMPSLEFSRPISDRVKIALEIGLPIPNDWPKDFGYKEKFGSFTLSAGTIFLF